MDIKIPNWIANTWKYFAGAAGAAVAAGLVVLMPHEPGDFNKQIVVGLDTTLVITGKDTARHATTEEDRQAKYRSAVEYDNGYRLHQWEYKTINTLTGEVTPELLLTIAPQIGTQVNWRVRCGAAELASEKIPELLETLPVEKAEEIGWVAVVDTVEKDDKGSVSLDKTWKNDVNAKAERVKFEASVDAGEVVEEIGVEDIGGTK
jgi:hypothetical protein